VLNKVRNFRVTYTYICSKIRTQSYGFSISVQKSADESKTGSGCILNHLSEREGSID
jgi:hypothetical protein